MHRIKLGKWDLTPLVQIIIWLRQNKQLLVSHQQLVIANLGVLHPSLQLNLHKSNNLQKKSKSNL